MNAYQVLVKKAKELGQPKHYENDLFVHDKSTLQKHHYTEFGWVCRDCGTFFLVQGCPLGLHSAIQHAAGQDNATFWYYKNGKLEQVEPWWLIGWMMREMTEKEAQKIISSYGRTHSARDPFWTAYANRHYSVQAIT